MTIIGVALAAAATASAVVLVVAFDHVKVCVHLIMQFEQITNNNNNRTQAQELKILVLGGMLVDFVGLNTEKKRIKYTRPQSFRISQSCKTGKPISSIAHILAHQEGVNFVNVF